MALRTAAVFVVGVLAISATALAAPTKGGPNVANSTGVQCTLPDSNADALEILSNYYPGYWWDHTDLTVAVQAHPKVDEASLAAVHQAIADWDIDPGLSMLLGVLWYVRGGGPVLPRLRRPVPAVAAA